jgi:hypothetical protein
MLTLKSSETEPQWILGEKRFKFQLLQILNISLTDRMFTRIFFEYQYISCDELDENVLNRIIMFLVLYKGLMF